MRFVVVVYRLSFGEGGAFEYDDGILGPFRTEERAEAKAASIRRAIDRAEWDEPSDRPDGVLVHPLNPGATPARDAVIAHLVSDVGA